MKAAQNSISFATLFILSSFESEVVCEEKSIFNQKKKTAGKTRSSSLAHNITCAVRDYLNAAM